MSDIYKLAGTEKVKPIPFDAHEQATRGEHVPTTADSPDKTDVQQYPKAVDHVEKPDAPEGHLEPIVAKDAAHEAELKKAAAEEKDEPKPAA